MCIRDRASEAREIERRRRQQVPTTSSSEESKKSVEARAYEFFLIFRCLFVNLILSFKERRLSQAFFLDKPDLKPVQAFEVIEVELNFIYDMVYTKAPVAHRKIGWALRSVCSGCLVSALLVFLLLDKRRHAISRVDVGITYALLLGGLALDAAALLMLLFSNRVKVFLEEESKRFRWLARLTRAVKRWRTRRWSGKTSQMNLIGYCLGKPGRYSSRGRRRWWLSAADKLGLEEVVDDFIFIRRVEVELISSSSAQLDEQQPRLLQFIFDGLKKAAKKLEEKKKQAEEAAAASTSMHIMQDGMMEMKKEIMEVCKCRGERVLEKREEKMRKSAPRPLPGLLGGGEETTAFDVIWDSVAKREFDESLLLWHIATDLCRGHPGVHAPMMQNVAWMKPIGETLSEYMLYLLIKQPEMLSATAGIGLLRYRDTCEEARRFFGSMEAWIGGDQHSAREMLLSVNTSEKPGKVKGDRSKSVLFDGVILAKALRELKDDELMWEVITGVWGEMLTYAAGKCRGSTHVRQLSRGGELITLVWFLMAHVGLGDMYQIQEGDAKAKLIVKDQ